LIVEDNSVNSLVLKRLLILIGVKKEEMVFVTNGKLAVNQVQVHKFDLILMVRLIKLS
jgi:CheY-like chemotaxis protein